MGHTGHVVLSIDTLRRELTAAARADQAEPMAAYMKHHFTFLGLKTPERRKVSKPWMAEADAAEIGAVLDFVERYTRLRANRQALSIDDKANGECLFLDGIDCLINPVKPAQCAGFPNAWNFPGWRQVCEAIPVEAPGGSTKESTCDTRTAG